MNVDQKIFMELVSNSPIAGVLLLLGMLTLRMLKQHFKQVKALVEENLQARIQTLEKLECNSERLGENSAVMRDVTSALRDLNRQLGRKPIQGER